MESALAPPVRLIEYPNELSGCDIVEIGGRQLLYTCPNIDGGKHLVVVLGYYIGQREDLVTKGLIEPIDDLNKAAIKEVLVGSLAKQYTNAQVFFL
jgi:hypothetical protein